MSDYDSPDEYFNLFPYRFLASILSEDFSYRSPLTFSAGYGKAILKGVEVIQERGKLPQVELSFELFGGEISYFYFGHLSPLKFHSIAKSAECTRADFNSHLDFLQRRRHEHAEELKELFASDFDANIIAGSLYLWRSCVGLAKVCPEDIVKYFSKMKSVSRYKWNMVLFVDDYDAVHEEWRASIPTKDGAKREIALFLKNGFIFKVKQL